MEIKINEYKHDQLMQLESIKQKSKYGKGSSNIKDNTPLINTIITILYTIADNTDKLNTIVSILNDKLGINIDAKDINSKTTKETLKKRLMIALNTPNMISASSKLNSYADAADNNGSSFYHTGLVVNRKDSSTLDTVEGNTGNGVLTLL